MKTINGKYGTYIANPKDDFVGRSLLEYGEYCDEEVRFLYQLIDNESVVVDIGANVGALTLPFARKAKKVYAFEPHPKLFNALCGMVALNDLDNVETFKVGIAEQQGVMGFQELNDKLSTNNGAHSLTENPDNEHQVFVTNIVPACNVLKIDVEGMELSVLKGATSMIKAAKPWIFVENDRAEKSDELIGYIRDVLEYDCYWCAWTLYNEHNFFKNPENFWGGPIGCINMICCPRGVFDFTTVGLKEAVVGKLWNDD